MSYLAKVITNAQRTVTKMAGTDITYKRGTAFVKLRAVKMSPHFSEQDNNQIYTNYKSWDFKFPVDELVINDLPIVPQNGDTIEEHIGNQIIKYKVGQPDDGSSQCWRFDSSFRTAYRVHAMEFGEVAA